VPRLLAFAAVVLLSIPGGAPSAAEPATAAPADAAALVRRLRGVPVTA